MDDDLRLYCVFSKEAIKLMNGNRGKIAAQSGHAFLHSFWDAEKRFPEKAEAYRLNLTRKITLCVETTQELFDLQKRYEPKCGVSLVKDAGFTVFTEPTVTCLGIGPIARIDCEEILSKLRPFI